jgi:hypothetical protein
MNTRAASLALAASFAAFVLLLSLHVLSPEYSPAWRMISEYANGEYGWVLSLMFVAYGLSSIALAVAIRSRATTRRARIGIVLLVLSGIAQASAAQFDLNDAAPHEMAGVLGIVCLPIAAVLLKRTFASSKPILIAADLTWVSVGLFVVSFPLMIATFLLAQGALPSAPPAELPVGVVAFVGWTDRLVVLSAWAWVAVVSCYTLARGVSSGSSSAARSQPPSVAPTSYVLR